MKILKSLLVGVTLCAASAPMYAANIRCEGCSPELMRQVAMHAGDGLHTVFSLSTNDIRSFEVEVLGAGEPPNAWPRAVSMEQLEEFSSLRGLYLQSGGTMKFNIEVPVGRIDLGLPISLSHWTAFDYAANPAAHGRFLNGVATYANSWSALRHAGTYWQTLGSITSLTGSSITVTVRFACGGFARFVVEGGHPQGQQIGPVTDRDGNQIPMPTDNPAQLSGVYHFSSGIEQSNFARHLSNLGWGVDWGQGGLSIIRPSNFICRWDAARTTLSCVAVGAN